MVDEAKNHVSTGHNNQQFNFMHSEYKQSRAIFLLDVLEHIEPSDEDNLKNISASLSKHGIVYLGMPSLESQTYAQHLLKRTCELQIWLGFPAIYKQIF